MTALTGDAQSESGIQVKKLHFPPYSDITTVGPITMVFYANKSE